MDDWVSFEVDINRNYSLYYEFKEIIFNTVDKLFCLVINLDRVTKAKYLRLSDIIKIESKVLETIGDLEKNLDEKNKKEFFFDPTLAKPCQ